MRIVRIVSGELQIANCVKIKTSVDKLSCALFLKAKKKKFQTLEYVDIEHKEDNIIKMEKKIQFLHLNQHIFILIYSLTEDFFLSCESFFYAVF